MAEEWIKRLARRVIEIIESGGETISRGTYESLTFKDALKKAANEQRKIADDNAAWIYMRNAVEESVKAMLRYRNRQAAEQHRPITAGVTAPAKGWLEHALPPGDRRN